MTSFKQTISELIKGINYIVEDAMSKTTKIYDGLITSSDSDNEKWVVQFNGEKHSLKPYGSIVPAKSMKVKVIIPENNMSLAFFI